MKRRKTLIALSLAAALCLVLSGCGKKANYTVRDPNTGATEQVTEKQAAEYQAAGWDVFAPGADIPEWEDPNTLSDAPDADGDDSGFGPVDPDSFTAPEAPVDTSGPSDSDVPEEVARIPSRSSLAVVSDSDATLTMTGTEREYLVQAWGEPRIPRDPNNGVPADVWSYDESGDISGSLTVMYDENLCVSEVIQVSNSGRTSGTLGQGGNPDTYWEDIGSSAFGSWAVQHTPDEIMDRIRQLTRTTVVNQMGGDSAVAGHWNTDGGMFAGDVFRVQDPMSNSWYWVAVAYKTQNRVIPDYVMTAVSPDAAAVPDLPNYVAGAYGG